jgi:predicted aminopeptidase
MKVDQNNPLVRAACKHVLLALALMLITSGCRIGYILHAAAGQFKLLAGAVPVEEALKETALPPGEQERLRLVARIKDFGETELGLKRTENYQTVYLKSRQGPIYTVAASPKDCLTRITWWFPIVGDMPYLGFFDLESARKERKKLLKKDLDVSLARADAYSTLGWFKDPVTLNLLEGTTLDLAETILHEMTHTTLYVKGQGEFNEGVAMLVGMLGARLFFERNYGPTHPLTMEAGVSIEDERVFSAFLATLMERLERLYASPSSYDEKLTEREKIFARAPPLQSLRSVPGIPGGLHQGNAPGTGMSCR